MFEREAAWWVTGLGAALLAAALAGRPAPAVRGAAEPPQQGAARLLYGLPLDLAREPAAVLEALPGIGPGRARAIVAARPFCSLSDLDRVPGIGPRTLERLEGSVSLGPGAPLRSECRGRD